ncbi:MAG TPA: immunoglobulin-like domain-containing protein [Candidatus Paceibacterota bacterium]|nr:immunoglobulin-like domain-containing protein [Candidatus Paceibacterota bacterium]
MSTFIKRVNWKIFFSTVLAIVMILGQLISPEVASAVTYDYTQSSWSGGATGNGAVHGMNQTDWTQYSSKSGTEAGSTISITPTQLSNTKTSQADFSGGTNSQTRVTDGGSVELSVDLSSSTTAMIASNSNTVHYLKADGTVWSWGYNGYGQIGDGTTTGRSLPVQVLGPGGTGVLSGIIEIAAGENSAYALKSDGTVWAWGYNAHGNLGDNSTTQRTTPVQVVGPGAVGFLTDVVSIGAADYSGYAVKSDGTVWAWGQNSSGQLGDNSTSQRNSPVQVLGTGAVGFLTGVIKVAGGSANGYALKSDGTVWSWGSNGSGRLGDNSTTQRTTPVQVQGVGGVGFLTDVVQIAGGDASGYAVKSDGTAWSWGSNGSGRLGDNTVTQRNTPVQVLGTGGTGFLTGVSKVMAGDANAYALKSDGTVWSWGSNGSGRLGDNTTTQRNAPVQVVGIGASGFLTDIVNIAGGSASGYALHSDGTARAWGLNSSNQLGDNTNTQRNSPIQVLAYTALALGDVEIAKIVAGDSSSYALKSDGTVWAWGQNNLGQLGDNTTTKRDNPVQVKGPGGVGFLTDVVEIAAGNFGAMAVKSDGTVWSWGYNSYGQVGDNSTTQRNAPVQVVGPGGVGFLTDVIKVTKPSYAYFSGASYALKSDGTVWAWGDNGSGQLGDNTTTSRSVPAQVLGPGAVGFLTDVVDIAASSHSGYAVKSDGTVWAWGNNGSGRLGDGTTTERRTPVQVVGLGGSGFLTDAIQVVADGEPFNGGAGHVLKSDGTVWSWGANGYGQLADGTNTAKNTPVQAVGPGGTGFLTGITQIESSMFGGRALKSDGTVWAWGYNNAGQVGDNSTTNRNTPVQVKSPDGADFLTDITAVQGGAYHSMAIKSDGTVWAWGQNNQGQLGDTTTTNRSTPVNVIDGTLINFSTVGGNLSYYSSGTYTSPVVDMGSSVSLSTVDYSRVLYGQTITVDVRAGNTPSPDGTWSSWQTNLASGADISSIAPARYVQFRANLSTSNITVTPSFDSITFNYTTYTSGDLTSSVFDTADATSLFGKILWSATNTSGTETVKFQVRSSPNNSTWTSWCGYADCSGSTYFEQAHNDVSLQAGHPLMGGDNDRYLQYKVFLASGGGVSPVVTSISFKYVINVAPNFNTSYPAEAGSGSTASQVTDSGSADFAKVAISYSVRDVDATLGTATPGQVLPSFEYSVNGGSTWNAIPSDHLGASDVSLKSVEEAAYTVHTATWNAALTIPETSINNARVRVTVSDGEAANSTAVSTTANFTLDVKAPVVTPVTFDAGVAGLTDSATITIPMPTDLSAVEYLISDDSATHSNPTNTGWTAITESTTIPWTFDSDIEVKTIKYQFRDALGNTSAEVSTSTQAPIAASSFFVQDASNLAIPSYDIYVGWESAGASGFSSYNLEFSTSADNITYGSFTSVAESWNSNPTTNYFVHRNLNPNLYYRYRLGVVGTNDNVSIRAGAFTTAKPDGVQNYDEGGGGIVASASAVENVEPIQEADKTVTITYRLTDASNAQKTNPSYEAYIFYNIGITLPANALSGGNLTVSNASKLPSSGYIQINNEVIKYTTKTGNVLGGLTRGTWPDLNTSGRTTRTNPTLFAGTPVWILANSTTPIAITNTTIPAGQNGSISWNTFNETALAGSAYANTGIRVLVHDNQSPSAGPLSTHNDYSEIGILNNFDLTAPSIAFDSTSASGDEAVASVLIPLSVARAYPLDISVNYAVTGTATSAVDYTLANGVFTLLAGETTGNISLNVIDDVASESDETVIITISNPVNTTLGGNTVFTYTILDNDGAPTVSFAEGTSSSAESAGTVNIPVNLSFSYREEVSVAYAVTGGTATAGDDFVLASGTLVIPSGSVSGNISASLVSDGLIEPDETVIISLSGPVNATLGANTTHTLTIVNSDEDGTAPVITLLGDNPMNIYRDAIFVDPGATSLDAVDGDLTEGIVVTGSVDSATIGTYTLTYTSTDTSDNVATLDRTVNVTLAPTYDITSSAGANGSITPLGVTAVTTTANQAYVVTPAEGYAVATLVVDGVSLNPTANLVSGTTYTFTNVINTHTISVTFILVEELDTTPPSITILGNNPMSVVRGEAFVDPGATASDVVDGDLTSAITKTGTVNTTAIGSYAITYRVEDAAGNVATAVRTVNVVLADTYNITATAGAGGTITPDGVTAVASTTSQAYTITPEENYEVATLVVDGISLAPAQSYTFTNVTETHTISVTFVNSSIVPPIITILGDNPMNLDTGNVFVDPGITATEADGVTAITDPEKISVFMTASNGAVLNSIDTTVGSSGNIITYRVTGSDGGIATATRTVNVEDVSPPVISNISTPIVTSDSVAIVWTTNEVADGQVWYGTTSGVHGSSSNLNANLVVTHLITLTELTPETTYYYIIESTDAEGNKATSEEQSFTTPEIEVTIISSGGGITGVMQSVYDALLAEYNLMKARAGEQDKVVPNISNLEVTGITPFSAIISFDIDKDAMGFVEYGKTTIYDFTVANRNFERKHSIKLHGLTLGTDYSIRVSAMDKYGNISTPVEQVFKTKFLSETMDELQNIENIEQFQKEIEAAIESILPSLVPPFLDRPEISSITENSAVIKFKTNIKAFPLISFADEAHYEASRNLDNPYAGEISDTSAKNLEHEMQLIGLKPDTRYNFMAKAFSLPQVIGKSANYTFITAAPKIRASVIDIKKDSFVILWNTDEPSTSIVQYKNMTTGVTSRISDETRTASHSVHVQNLRPGTSYEVTVSGLNSRGNLIEGGSPITVRTQTDSTPPVISNLKVESNLVTGRTDRVQTIISWQTDEPSDSIVYFEEGSGSSTKELSGKIVNPELTKNHLVILSAMKPATVYRFAVSSTDDANNTVKPPVRTFITPRKSESIVDIIFKNFDDTFNFINNVR